MGACLRAFLNTIALISGGIPPAHGQPLPLGIDSVGPHAFGAFVASMDGVTEMSQGNNVLFQVNNAEKLHNASYCIQSSVQFIRLGPVVAARLGTPPEAPLLEVFTLDQMTGPPHRYIGFNITA